MTVVSQNAQPVYRTATIRKLKRTHEDSLASSVSTNDSLRISSSTIGSQFQPSRPILRSASVIKTKNIKNDLCHYGAYTDDQPENLIFRRGQLKLVVCGSDGRLSVTILEARSLPFRDAPDAQVWLEVHLLPGGDVDSKNRISHTSARVSASDPTFGETFTFEINERPASGTKLFITLFLEIGNDARTTEFAGCMSFGARKIIQEKSIFKGWYYLLSETLGRRKHLVVSKVPQNHPLNGFDRRTSQSAQQQSAPSSTSSWSTSSSSSSATSTGSSELSSDYHQNNYGSLQRSRTVRWGRDIVYNMTPTKPNTPAKATINTLTNNNEEDINDSLHGQDITVLQKTERREIKVQRGWCGFGFTLIGENPVKVETVFNECVGAQAGIQPGDQIISANQTDLKSSTGREAQKVILKAVADLDLVISRKFNPESVRYQAASDIYQSPAKISRRYCPDSEDSEDSDVLPIPSLAPRLKGMDTLLKFDCGIQKQNILQGGRDLIYSGSCRVTISGIPDKQRVWIILMSDIMLMTEYDPVEQQYVIIEDVINLRDSILKYEAIKPDGTPDLSWTLNVHDQAGFGIRRYTFEGDSAELAAMWKCCLSRQIDLNRSKTDGDSAKPNQELDSPRTPSRTRSEADMNRLGLDQRYPTSMVTGQTYDHRVKNNRRKSFGTGRLDFGVAELMSRARDSIRNRRRNSSANPNQFSSQNSSVSSYGLTSADYVHSRMSNMVVEEQENEYEYYGLKSSSRNASSTDLKIDINSASPIKPTGNQNGRKLSASCLMKNNSSSTLRKGSSSSQSDQQNDSLDSDVQERKSLPERVNFAATWVSARLLKRHRERRARRMNDDDSGCADITTSTTSNASCISALSALSDADIELCKSGLQAVIQNDSCLAAFKEFLKKEHSNENLDFWLESEKYRNSDDRQPIATFILENFIQAGSLQEINIDSELHRLVTSGLEMDPPSGDCLIKAQEHVFKLMQTDTYSRFIKTLP